MVITGTAHCERRYETDIKRPEGNKPNQHRQLTGPEPTTSNEEKKQVSMCPCPGRRVPKTHAAILSSERVTTHVVHSPVFVSVTYGRRVLGFKQALDLFILSPCAPTARARNDDSHAEIPFKFHHLNSGGPAIW